MQKYDTPILILFVSMLLVSRLAYAEEPEVVAQYRPATPIAVVLPEFPKGAVPPEGGAAVQIILKIDRSGRAHDAKVFSSGGSEAFTAAVANVVDAWKFAPAFDPLTCQPVDDNYSETVWFEGTEDEPHIFVTRPKKSNVDEAISQRRFRPLRWETPPEINFPPRATHEGYRAGAVDVVIVVDYTGHIVSSQILASLPKSWFGEAVLAGLKNARFSENGRPDDPPVCVRWQVGFRTS